MLQTDMQSAKEPHKGHFVLKARVGLHERSD